MWRSARVDDPGELSSSEERDPGNGHNNTNDQRAVLKYDLPRNSDSNLNLGLRQLNLSSVWQDIPTSLPSEKGKVSRKKKMARIMCAE